LLRLLSVLDRRLASDAERAQRRVAHECALHHGAVPDEMGAPRSELTADDLAEIDAVIAAAKER